MKKISLLTLLFSIWTFGQQTVLNQKIQSIISNKKATVGISVLGFENGFAYHKNADKELPMLSVFKFHIACAVLDLVDQGVLSLNQAFLLKESELSADTWSPIKKKYPKGNVTLSLNEILDYTVALSDNNGCDYLLKLIGGPQKVQEFMNSKGVKGVQIKVNEAEMHQNWKNQYLNYSTTISAVRLLKDFYDGKILSKNSTDYLMQIMLGTKTGINKLIEQLPKNTPIAHKTGSSGKYDNDLTVAENDIGIITLPNGNHYAIAVLVSNSTESDAVNCRMISDISKAVWDDLNK